MTRELHLTKNLTVLDLENIKKSYLYCPITGIVTNSETNQQIPNDQINVIVDSVVEQEQRIRMRKDRLCLYLHTGKIEKYVKFKDGNKNNYKLENLQTFTHSQKLMMRKKRKDNQYDYKGVKKQFNGNLYGCVLMVDYKFKTISGFKTQEEAAKYYDAMARHYHGEFCSPNFKEEFIPKGDVRFLRKYRDHIKKQNGECIIGASKKSTPVIVKKAKVVNKNSPVEILEFIKNTYEYIKETGNIINKNTNNRIISTDVILQDKFDYIYNIPRHRLVWFLNYNELPTLIDHIDRNPKNNKIENLRKASYSENATNTTFSPNKHGYKGVYYTNSKNRYTAHITKEHINYSVDGLLTPLEASKYYDSLCRYYHGEFGVTNHVNVYIPPMSEIELRLYRDRNKNKFVPMSDEEFEKQLEGRSAGF